MVKQLLLSFKQSIFLISFLLFATSSTAAVLAKVDQSVISENETITLSIRSDKSSAKPDFSLIEVNFDILYTQTSQQSSISSASGRSSIAEWTLTLAPKHTGTLRIPEISIGGELTTTIDVKVLPISPELKKQLDQQFFIEIEIDSKSVYVEEPFLLTVRFFYLGSIQGTWNEVNVNNAIYENWVEGKRYQESRNGNTYQVVEQLYLFKPLSPGKLNMPIFGVSGEFQSTTWGKRTRLNVNSKPLIVEVKDIPVSWPSSAPWLPAKSLSLKENWTGLDQASDSIHRQIELEILNQSKSSLPEIKLPKSAQLKIYADKPEIEEQKTTLGPMVTQKENWALIPINNGQISVPELKIYWWNTQTDKLETALLSGKTMRVANAATGNLNNQTRSSSQEVIPELPIDEIEASSLTSAPDASIAPLITEIDSLQTQLNTWRLVSLLLIGIVVVLTGLFIFFRKVAAPTEVSETTSAPKAKKYWQELERACKENNAIKVRQVILLAVNEQTGLNVPSLSKLIEVCKQKNLTLQIQLLDQSLFSQSASHHSDFNGQVFWKLIKSCPFKEERKVKPSYSNTLYG